jgi:hypothetical protein
MPIEVGIWKINGKVEKINFSPLDDEKKLETILCSDLSILDPDYLLIGNQVLTAYGKVIDILAMNQEGDLVIVELKRNRTPRDVIAQILDYASWVSDLTIKDIENIFLEKNNGKEFEKGYEEKFGNELPERINENHSLVIVASELDNSTERIINYISNFGVPVNAVFFRYFEDGNAKFLVRSWLINPKQAESQATRSGISRKSKDIWNGRDWYASLGVGLRRTWEDCRKYGYISAGGGKWYSNTLNLLPIGARVFVNVPQQGYVGVAEVISKATPVGKFEIEYKGKKRKLLDLELHAPNITDDMDDPELAEYMVGVRWIKTVDLDDAVKEKGLFGNQNSACKLRNSHTIERLTQIFELEEE